MLKTSTRKTKYGYRGYVICYNGKKRLWCESAGIDRIKREHAQEDANLRKKDREQTWV